MYATEADAHLEWHHNTGIPVGQPGCPQDACHLPDPYCWECCDDGSDCPECREVREMPKLETLLANDPWGWGTPAEPDLPF